PAGRGIPELDRPVPTDGGDAESVGAELHASDPVRMPPEPEEIEPAGHLEDVDHRAGRAGQPPPEGVERDALVALAIAAQGGKLPAGCHVQDRHVGGMESLGLLAGHRESMAIGAEPEGLDAAVSDEDPDRSSRLRVPDPYAPVAAGRGEPTAIGAVGH